MAAHLGDLDAPRLLRRIDGVSLFLGVVIALAGWIVLDSSAFAAWCLLGVMADHALVALLAPRIRSDNDARSAAQVTSAFVGARLLIKVVVILTALFFASDPGFWGAIAGVLLFDLVLMSAGALTGSLGSALRPGKDG